MAEENLSAMARIFSTDTLSPFPQYWAARMVVPMVSAARNRLRTNCICPARETADKAS